MKTVSMARKVCIKMGNILDNWETHFPKNEKYCTIMSKEHIQGLKKGLQFMTAIQPSDTCTGEICSLFTSCFVNEVICFECMG